MKNKTLKNDETKAMTINDLTKKEELKKQLEDLKTMLNSMSNSASVPEERFKMR